MSQKVFTTDGMKRYNSAMSTSRKVAVIGYRLATGDTNSSENPVTMAAMTALNGTVYPPYSEDPLLMTEMFPVEDAENPDTWYMEYGITLTPDIFTGQAFEAKEIGLYAKEYIIPVIYNVMENYFTNTSYVTYGTTSSRPAVWKSIKNTPAFYDLNTSYPLNSFVRYDNSGAYRFYRQKSNTPTPLNTPPTDTTYWEEVLLDPAQTGYGATFWTLIPEWATADDTILVPVPATSNISNPFLFYVMTRLDYPIPVTADIAIVIRLRIGMTQNQISVIVHFNDTDCVEFAETQMEFLASIDTQNAMIRDLKRQIEALS